MKTNTIQIRAILALAAFICTVPAAYAECDLVVPTSTTTTLTESQTVDCFKIKGNGTLEIATSVTLTVDGAGDAPHTTSSISSSGTLILEGSGSTLAFTNNNHFVVSGGTIDGQSNSAQISIASGVTLLSEVDITGNLKITGAGD